MNKSISDMKQLIERVKGENPIYSEILDFYGKVFEEQGKLTPHLNIVPVEIHTSTIERKMKEGAPLLNRDDFILDIPASVSLFQSICRIMMTANEKMNADVQAIEEAISSGTLETEALLRRYDEKSFTRRIAEELDIEESMLTFLIQMSIEPSIRANVQPLSGRVKSQHWLRGYCPVCGSPPQLAEIKAEGQRYLLCSFCAFEWLGLRLQCPYCENSDHSQLHYLYAEKQQAYRVDLCEQCAQYIKTIDSRKLEYEPFLFLEDIVSTHLDIIASEKGYKRRANDIGKGIISFEQR